MFFKVGIEQCVFNGQSCPTKKNIFLLTLSRTEINVEDCHFYVYGHTNFSGWTLTDNVQTTFCSK